MRRRRKKIKKNEQSVDRISQLPDEIIYLILQSLDLHKSAARTSVLSRRWLHLWHSYPVVEFQGYYGRKSFKFQSFAAATSNRLQAVPLLLDSFTVVLQQSKNLGQEFYQLLSSASVGVDNGGRSPLNVVVKNFGSSIMFEGGMLLNCGRTKFLQLEGFDLSRLHKTCLDNLQQLDLQFVVVSQESFPSCLANSPRLKKLSLKYIRGIHNMVISASNFPSLRSLFLDGRLDLQLSSAPHLQSLSFRGRNLSVVTSSSAPNVKKLDFEPLGELRGREISDSISKLPSLKSLLFNSLSIRGSDGMQFEIDAPNLVILTIKTRGFKINPIVVSMAPSCRCVVASSIRSYMITKSWFLDLRERLTSLATSFRHLVFELDFPYFHKVSDLDLSQVGCESPPLMVQHLHLGTNILPLGAANLEKQADKTLLLDALLSTFHPKMVSVAQRQHSCHRRSLFSYISNQIEMKNLRKCCNNEKCWRHQFKDAEIRSVTVDDILTIDKSMTSQPSIAMFISFSSRDFNH